MAQPPYNLTRSDFNIYTNRWGTAHKVLDALLITKADETESGEDEYTCRGWQALLRFYLDAPIMKGADDTDDIVTVYQGIQNMEVLLQAIIAHQVGKDIVRIIDDCKTDGDDFPVDLSDRILSARRNWVGMSTVPQITVDAAWALLIESSSYDLSTSAADASAVKSRVKGQVRSMAGALLLNYDKHWVPFMVVTGKKFMYDNRRQPEVPADDKYNREFFGCLPQDYGMPIVSQWIDFVNCWPHMADSDKKKGAKTFWAMEGVKNKYPLLAKLGLYYSTIPLSSVAAERAFGVMRTLESPQRMSMDATTFKSIFLAAGNKWLVERELKAASIGL